MPDSHYPSIRDALRAALTAAAKRKDRVALSVYRTALAAIDNAEAVPLPDGARSAGGLEACAVGVGAAEAERLQLTEERMRAIVDAEVEERQHAADQFDRHGSQTDRAQALRDEAGLLEALLADTR